MSSELSDIKRIRREEARIIGGARTLSVLFVDLVGWSAVNDEISGVRRIFRHRQIVSDHVDKAGGKVVKYVGDEVIAIFPEPRAAACAAAAAQAHLKELSRRDAPESPLALTSKMAITHGRVYPFPVFSGSSPGRSARAGTPESLELIDPVGVTVAIAARLAAYAKPDQILCTSEVVELIGHDFAVSQPVFDRLKGFGVNLAIYEIQWSALQPLQGIHPPDDAALSSVEEISAPAHAIASKLETLTGEFDALLSRMQTPKARAGMKRAFGASPKRLGKAAVAAARKRG